MGELTLLGFYLGLHDSNMCVVHNGCIRYRKFERRSGIKHERVDLRAVIDTCREWNVSPDYVAFSDGDRNGLGSCAVNELFRETQIDIGLPSGRKTYHVDHHYSHILSAWPAAGGRSATLGIALDGRGDNDIRARVVRLGNGVDAESVFQSSEMGVGRFFTRVGRRLGFRGSDIDFAGKVMGAQAYGTTDPEQVDRYVNEAPQSLPNRLLFDIPWRGVVPANNPSFFDMRSASFLDWLATCHQLLSGAMERFVRSFCASDDEVVFYAGGCAQNTVFNRALADRVPNLVIAPHAYDGGQSLGCVEFLRRTLGLPGFSWPSFPFAQDDEKIGSPSSATIERVASLLAGGAVVGWMTGHGEIGPRALGHRSILFDPRIRNARRVLNRRVKSREAWRPYAASVLAEEAGKWFDAPRPCDYMLEAVPTHDARRDLIEGITHRDGTCRIQTVGASEELGEFRQLLASFNACTGVPALLNTSLNAAGEPIYGSAAQGRRLFQSGRLDALCVGDELLERG